MKILGIETSCDETAAAVVTMYKDKPCTLLSNVVATSLDLHAQYGGVVPEIAARSHIESIIPVINQALLEARYGRGLNLNGTGGKDEQRTMPYRKYSEGTAKPLTRQSVKNASDDLWDEIDGIAVTYGAGLGGSLLIGVLAARTLALVKNKLLYPVNHVEGHVYANFLTDTSLAGYILPPKAPEFPMLALIVSGGHTQLVLFRGHFDYTLLGQTHDDAIGEAFDKVAKIIGLTYPGGPSIAKAAKNGDPKALQLPKAKTADQYGFSFSGLKTAVLRAAQNLCDKSYDFPSFKLATLLNDSQKADIAASFQHTAIETVVDKTYLAYQEFKPESVVIAGGVAANQELRQQLSHKLPLPIKYTDPKLCTDNGAMIAALGNYIAIYRSKAVNPYLLEISPSLSM